VGSRGQGKPTQREKGKGEGKQSGGGETLGAWLSPPLQESFRGTGLETELPHFGKVAIWRKTRRGAERGKKKGSLPERKSLDLESEITTGLYP